MSKNHLEVCVLSAGLGKRMKSTKPKALQTIAGRPLLEHLLDTVETLGARQVHVVVGQGAEAVKAAFPDRPVNWVEQAERLGTGHAVMQAMPHVGDDARLLILLGDEPLIRSETMKMLVDEECHLGVLSVDQPNPFNYGRIIRGKDGQFLKIVEERDATEAERLIREINTGMMVANAADLRGWLARLGKQNDQKEYLLTDIVGIAVSEGKRVSAIKCDDAIETLGINTLEQLSVLEREYQRRVARQLMADGVRLIDPARIDVRGRVLAGHDVTVDINCIFEGECHIGDNVTIGANCIIRESRIGNDCEIKPNSIVDEAEMESGCIIGPFARIRPGTRLAREVHIGNFVEVKKAIVGEGTKANHLSYLGDAVIGAGVNIGAGTITCNYDGVAKHETRIDDHVFVGSNTALVAPVTVGEWSTIAAGSTITKNVEPRQLAIARGRQKSIAGWKGPRDS